MARAESSVGAQAIVPRVVALVSGNQCFQLKMGAFTRDSFLQNSFSR